MKFFINSQYNGKVTIFFRSGPQCIICNVLLKTFANIKRKHVRF